MGHHRVLRAVGALALALAAGCGGEGARDVLKETTSNLARVNSGDLRLAMTATAGAEGQQRPVGFEVSGPFSAPSRPGELPVARLRRTRLAGAAVEPTTFVSTGQRAFLEVAGRAYELPEAQLRGLRATEAPEEAGTGLQRLDLAAWARDPQVSEAGQVDGTPVQRVTGGVDVVKALGDLVAVANQLGAAPGEGLAPVDPRSAGQVERAVRSSRLEVLTGKEDRLLRRARLDVTFAATDLGALEQALGPLAGSRLSLEIDLAGLNRKVEVPPPPSPRPLSELRRRP